MPTDNEASTHDTTRIDDVRIAAVRALVSPAVLLEELPATPAVEALVERVLPGREVLAHLRASKSPKPGSVLELEEKQLLIPPSPDAQRLRATFTTL